MSEKGKESKEKAAQADNEKTAATIRNRGVVTNGFGFPKPSDKTPLSFKDTMKESIIRNFGPPSVLIDDRLQVLYFQGDTSPFLRQPEGEANLDIIQMSRDEVRLDLRSLVHRCSRVNIPCVSRPLTVPVDGNDKNIVIHVNPVDIPGAARGLMTVAFKELQSYEYRKKKISHKEGVDPRVQELETMGLISRICLQSDDLNYIYEEIPRLISRRFGFPFVAIDLYADDKIVTVGTTAPDYDMNHPISVQAEKALSAMAIETRSPFTLNDSADSKQKPSHPAFKKQALKTLLSIPLLLQEKVVGVLVMADDKDRKDINGIQKTLSVITHHLALEIERKRIAQTLARQKETLQSIMDHIPIMLAFYDRNGNFQYINKYFEDLLGYSLDELKESENPMEKFYPDPDYRAEVWQHMLKADQGWQDFSVTTHNGEKLDSSWANVKLSDGSQIGIGIDIRQRKQWEEKLRQSEEKFRLIAETVEDVFWMKDAGTDKFIYVSPAYEQIWGRKINDLYKNHENLMETIHPDDREVVKAIHDNPTDRFTPLEYRIIKPEGNVRWIHERMFPVKDEDGRLRFIVGAASDVTDMKEAEKLLKSQTIKLEKKNSELNHFTHLVSHDLQEPLRKIHTFAGILKSEYSEALGKDAKDLMLRMLDATSRMRKLISSLLEYSRINGVKPDNQPTELGPAIEEAISNLHINVEESQAQIDVHIEGICPVNANHIQLVHFFQNIIGNALKFHREGITPQINISGCLMNPETGRQVKNPRPGIHCRVVIEDNGIGIDSKYLDRIFNPFERLNDGDYYAGTGMGLAICRKIVDQLGGNLSAKSIKGKGTKFIVDFPL